MRNARKSHSRSVQTDLAVLAPPTKGGTIQSKAIHSPCQSPKAPTTGQGYQFPDPAPVHSIVRVGQWDEDRTNGANKVPDIVAAFAVGAVPTRAVAKPEATEVASGKTNNRGRPLSFRPSR